MINEYIYCNPAYVENLINEHMELDKFVKYDII